MLGVLFEFGIGDVGEADAHGGFFACVVDVAKKHHISAVAGAELVDGCIQFALLF